MGVLGKKREIMKQNKYWIDNGWIFPQLDENQQNQEIQGSQPMSK